MSDDFRRSRLTVLLRLILAIPHFIWLWLWTIAAAVVVIVNWFATLITGRTPQGLFNFLTAYLRYATHLFAYVGLARESVSRLPRGARLSRGRGVRRACRGRTAG